MKTSTGHVSLRIAQILIALYFVSVALGQAMSPVPIQSPSPNPIGSRSAAASPTPIEGRDISEKPERGQDIRLSNGVVHEVYSLYDVSQTSLTFKNITFERDVKVDGIYQNIMFEDCHFKGNVQFYVVRSLTLTIRNCEFLGSVVFNMDVVGFTLRECDFSKTVNLYGAEFGKATAINITRNTTKEPIRILWSQFGEKWLRDLITSTNLGGNARQSDSTERQTNIRHVLTELEFWRENFDKLGHKRDATEVLYEINEYVRVQGIQPRTLDYYLGFLLKWPSRFGTRPYRPLWLGLIVVLIFALLYWIKDPFTEKDKSKPPSKPRTPRSIFALMYSIDTFVPIFELTRVKDWGWEISPPYRWVAVVERLLGLLIFYAAAYSLTYYVL